MVKILKENISKTESKNLRRKKHNTTRVNKHSKRIKWLMLTKIWLIFIGVTPLSLFALNDVNTHGITTDIVRQEISLAQSYLEEAKCLIENAELDLSTLYYKKAAILYRKNGIWDKYIQVLHKIGSNNLKKAKPDTALVYFKKALFASNQYLDKNHPILANNLLYMGKYHCEKGNYDKALEYINNALKLKTEIPGSGINNIEGQTDVTRFYNALGVCYQSKGDYDIALEHYNKVLNIRTGIFGEKHTDIALVYDDIANCYRLKGNHTQALEYYNKALNIKTRIFGEIHANVAMSYNYIGVCYRAKENYDLALEYHNKSLDIKTKIFSEENLDMALSYNNIGVCYSKKGDDDRALEYHKKALNIKTKVLGSNHPEIALSCLNIGRCYQRKKNYDKALEYHEKSLDIKIKIFGKNHIRVALSYCDVTTCYRKKKDYDKALEYALKGLNIRTKVFGDKHISVARSYNIVGVSYFIKKDYDIAIKYHKKALNTYNNLFDSDVYGRGGHPEIARTYYNIGNCYGKKENSDKALIYYQKALTAISGGFKNMDIAANPSLGDITSKKILLNILKMKAVALHNKYQTTQNIDDLKLSFATSQLVVSLIDMCQFEIISTHSKQKLMDKSIAKYEQAIDKAFRLYELTQEKEFLYEAFRIAEKSKAFLLLQALKVSKAKQFASIPNTLLSMEKENSQNLAYYEKLLNHELRKQDSLRKKSNINLWKDNIFRLKRQRDSLIVHFEAHYPDYYRLKYDINVATVDQIQQKILTDDQVFIEYFTGDSSIYVFNITKNDFRTRRLKKPDNLEKQVSDLRKSLSDDKFRINSALEAYQSYTQNAYKLYDLLLSKSITKYENSFTQFIIVPDGPLSFIPFEVLLQKQIHHVESIDEIDYQKLPYLMLNHQFNYSYSGTLLLENKKKEKVKAAKACLSFAPTYPGKNSDIASRGTMRTLRNSSLTSLPGALQEVKHISRYFDGHFFTGTEASEIRFKQEAGKYLITHLAMHGVSDRQNPLYSKLFFSTTKESTEDDTLYAYELYNMNIPSDLVVLSACETGAGQYVRGEGIMSIARAFMYAGNPSVVQTLWNVEDNASATLMDFFYEGLAKGMNKSEALQQSKLRYLASEKEDNFDNHPFFWAGFVLNGDTAPLPIRKSRKWLYLSFAFGIAITGWLVYTRSGKRNV